MHALLHGDNSLSKRDVRDPWTAGFSRAKLTNVNGAGYVTKYVTKTMIDEGAKRPRIRASRDPTYGGVVMLQEAEDVREAQRKVNLEQATWTANLRAALKLIEPRDRTLWDTMQEMEKMNHGKRQHERPDGYPAIDEETGELLR